MRWENGSSDYKKISILAAFMMDNRASFSEKELLTRIANGEQKAFNTLFEQYRDRLFVYLFKITKSKETAEEIVLDVFLKIWTGRSLVTQIDHFEAFLFCIARNKAFDFLRWVQKSRLQQMEIWQSMQKLTSTEFADNQTLLEDAVSVVKEAVTQLSPQRKKIFQLSREQGLTYAQIAKKLHLSTHTVRNHIAASLQFIRAHLPADNTYIFIAFLLLKLKP